MLIRINRLGYIQPRWRGTAEACPGHQDGARGFSRVREGMRPLLKHAGAALLLLAMLATAAQADPRSELAQARHDLSISEQVLARVSERVTAARADPATAPEERRRLDDYLARVRDLVELNRERVRSLEQTVAVLPAGAPGGGQGAAAGASASTHTEDVAALDEKLSGSLAEIDQLLLEEARKARARAPTRASAERSAGGSSASAARKGTNSPRGDGTDASGGANAAEDKTDPEQSGRGPGSPGGRIEGTDPGTPGATAAIPPDVGDGSDDDIVARQIRRAAETETDPELREKLWDEYRKYKRGTKG